MDDLNELIEGAENPVTEGNAEDFQENFENLPDIEPQETTTTTNNQQLAPEGRSQTEERNPLNIGGAVDTVQDVVNNNKWVRENIYVPIVDTVDNVFQGNQRTREQVLEDRTAFETQAAERRVEADKNIREMYSGPNAV